MPLKQFSHTQFTVFMVSKRKNTLYQSFQQLHKIISLQRWKIYDIESWHSSATKFTRLCIEYEDSNLSNSLWKIQKQKETQKTPLHFSTELRYRFHCTDKNRQYSAASKNNESWKVRKDIGRETRTSHCESTKGWLQKTPGIGPKRYIWCFSAKNFISS